MRNPVSVVPGAIDALQALAACTQDRGVPPQTLELAHLRASQINGGSVCVDLHSRNLKKAGETDEQLAAAAARRHIPHFTEAERAALALAEALTRLNDREDP
jgi:AhpD family alkylhydroperoxidase